MSTIVLKTARRNTKVSRIKVRRAVVATYSESTALPNAKNSAVISLTKKTPAKKLVDKMLLKG
jgi:hypothetical protein